MLKLLVIVIMFVGLIPIGKDFLAYPFWQGTLPAKNLDQSCFYN